MRQRALWMTALTALALGIVIAGTYQASANCHIATFDENQVVVDEPGGEARLVVELDGTGPVTCTGSIRWKTGDRTAKAPGDYTASQGELRWRAGSERRQSFAVPIKDDTLTEGSEIFTVTLTAGPGGIRPEEAAPGQGGPVAIVRIRDDESPPETESPTPDETVGPTSPSPTPATPTPTPTPTEQGTSTDSGGPSGGLIAGLAVAALALVGGLGAVWLRSRRSA